MKYTKILILCGFLFLLTFGACSSFNYKTYDEKQNEGIDDPEPNYELTLEPGFQDFTSFMFIGNRIENFSTYFNTYFNASENFDEAYDDYATRVLSNYNEKQDSIFARPRLSQESIDKFNIAIEKASKVIQYHKSSEFMDRSVLLVGKSYYFLGDYLKAERKFGEFISKLKSSRYLDEALMYLAKTQLRLENEPPAIDRLNNLIKTSKDESVVSESYQSIAEYYLNKKDYENAIKNFKNAIKYSGDNGFKAQMQFLVASVTAKSDPKKAALEFDRVLDYSPSFDLEYLARYNYAKNKVLAGKFSDALPELEDLEVKYKDNALFLSQVNFLKGSYYEEKKDNSRAIKQYYNVIKNFPQTVASSDASCRVGQYFENDQNDYLNALRYYRFAAEQSTAGILYPLALSKASVFKRYFELKSTILGTVINTEYDAEFKKNTILEIEGQDPNAPPKGFDEGGKNGGERMIIYDSTEGESKFNELDTFSIQDTDTLITEYVDSTAIREKEISEAKFELAELFLYDLNRLDSSEIYLIDALGSSNDYDFTAKVLFALADLYRKDNRDEKSNETLRRIINEFPLSEMANSSRRLLNLSVTEETIGDRADSVYNSAETSFISGDYSASLVKFKELIAAFPDSKHLDKAMYACGWIYENILMKSDSAYYYYSSLLQALPNTEAAAMVMQKVEQYESFNKSPVDTSASVIDTSKVKKESEVPVNKDTELKIKDGSEQIDSEGNTIQKSTEENMKKEDEIIPPSDDGN